MTLPQPEIEYQVEADQTLGGATSFAGLPALLQAAKALGVSSDLAKLGVFKTRPGSREQKYSEALLALLASGGECLSDIEALRSDPGLKALLGDSSLPDARRLGEFLAAFHDPKIGKGGELGRAVIAPESLPLKMLGRVNSNLIARIQQLSPCRRATLDWDTQCIEADKQDALWCYKGFPGYQPGAIEWREQGLILSDQFRAGNVNSGFKIGDFVRDAIAALPPSVEEIAFRGDSAAYDRDLMNELQDREIPFAITADSNQTLRDAIQALPPEAWSKLHRLSEVGKIWKGEDWAEVVYVSPNDTSLKREPLRYIVIRYPIRSRAGEEQTGQADLALPLDAEEFKKRYRVVVSNRSEAGDQILLWSSERCGSIERVFRVMNNDQAAASPPCGKFGANAAWYRFNVLLYNLMQAMRLLVLPEDLSRRSLKGIRLQLFRLAGRVVRGSSRIWQLKIRAESQALKWLQDLQETIAQLAQKVRNLPVYAPS